MSWPAACFGPAYGFGLYVHWPYCSRICPYCDFNVYLARNRSGDDLVTAILADIRRHRDLMPAHPELGSVYFGGGTPALMSPAQAGRILAAASETFGIGRGAEITLEANPNDILRADLAGFAAAGVNRLSVGVQSLRDEDLVFLGRDHDAAAAVRAVSLALPAFRSVSVDLIYARPGQSGEAWEAELREAIALGAGHLSLYELTIEPATAFGKAVERGQLVPMTDDLQADLYELTQEITRSSGLPAYEVSNHARAADHQSRHNSVYWQGGDWIGVGPGAHGRISISADRYATEAIRRPGDYIRRLLEPGAVLPAPERLGRMDVARELLAMGLRPVTGLDLRRIEALSGQSVPSAVLETMEEAGWVCRDGPMLRLTGSGRLLADAVTARLSP